MQLETIPKAMQPDVIHSYWVMMQELQSKAHSDNDAVLMNWVEGFYRQWNQMTGDNKRPIWVKEQA